MMQFLVSCCLMKMEHQFLLRYHKLQEQNLEVVPQVALAGQMKTHLQLH